MDKIAKIRSQPAKYNVFCRTEAGGIISSVTKYRISKNCDHPIIVPYLLSITGKKIIMLFSYHNAMEMKLKLEELRNFYTINFMVRHI